MSLIDNTILTKFKEITKRLFLMHKELLSNVNIKRSYYTILTVLSINESLTQTTLGEVCGMDKPAISRLVNKMETESLIEKNYKDGNKKNIHISLSQKGKEIFLNLNKKLEQIKQKYFFDLNSDEKQTLLSLLNKTLGKEENTIC